MTRTIPVSSLRIEAASGDTCYPGENGFSSVWAEAQCTDPALTEQLSRIALDGHIVTLRCGALGVTGSLINRGAQGNGALFVVRIESIDHGVPRNSEPNPPLLR